MTQLKECKSGNVRELRLTTKETSQPTKPSDLVSPATVYRRSMKLIPWDEIWVSLSFAKIRGKREMIDVFYDTLFKEAVFDDKGAWCVDLRKSN
jgi:hypothetical protein